MLTFFYLVVCTTLLEGAVFTSSQTSLPREVLQDQFRQRQVVLYGEQVAKTFLSRKRRYNVGDLVEECDEGCDGEEIEELVGSWERRCEFIEWYKVGRGGSCWRSGPHQGALTNGYTVNRYNNDCNGRGLDARCEDINECSEGSDDCTHDAGRVCTNTPGSFECSCATSPGSGYYGNGRSGCTPICQNFSPGSGQCKNGGTCNSPDSCSCPIEFYAPACDACPVADIDNCAHMSCDPGPTNKRCFDCILQYQTILDKCAYTHNSAKTFCDLRCSWPHHHCFPGACSTGYPSSCSCATGFSSSGSGMCDLTIQPELHICKVTVESVDGEKRQSQPTVLTSTSCYTEGDEWIKFIPETFKLDFEATFEHPPYTKLAYVSDYKYGITKSSIKMYKVPSGSNVDILTYTMPGHGSCTPNVLGDDTGQPTDQLTCDVDKTLSYQSFADGDKLCFKFEAVSGGYTHYKDPNTNVFEKTQKYTDVLRNKEICMRMDFTFPTHCSRDSGSDKCASPTEYMTFGKRIRITGVIPLDYAGWQDLGTNPSGIKEYIVNVYEIVERSSTTVGMVFSPVKVGPLTVTSSVTSMDFTLPAEPQFYAIDLTVVDNALNVKQARSYVLYDDSSKLLIDSSKEFYFKSATNVTNYLWQTNLNSLKLSWTDYFYNDYHRAHHPLRPIEAEQTYFTDEYDQIAGSLPRAGTPNIHGILEFMYHIEELTPLGTDDPATPQPTSWTNVTTWLDEDLTLGSSIVTPEDGDTYKVWIQGTDIMDNTVVDERMIHIDSSPPELWDMWLTKDGHDEVYVHDWHELHTMALVFRAHDVHSGLRKVFYRLGTTTGGSSEHGQGFIPVVHLGTGETCPVGGDPCYCPSIGPCEMSSYLLDLNPIVSNATNVGLHDRDYFFEIELENEARLVKIFELKIFTDNSPPVNGTVWDGSPGQTDVDYKSDDTVVGSWLGFVDHESGIRYYRYAVAERCWTTDELYSNGTKTTSTTTGSLTTSLTHYYISVIAINNAITPSVPSCSDGVIIDSTPPVFVNYTMKHGIFTNGQPPIYHHKDSLELTWVFTEAESQIRDYEIGFASNIANTASPDVVGYQSTDMKSHFKKLHTGFGQASRVFVMVKAINKAGLEVVEAIGPFIIDQTPPTSSKTFTPNVGSTHVTLSWSPSDFSDDEDENALTRFRWALGTSDSTQELVPFTNILGDSGTYQAEFVLQDLINHDNEFDKTYHFSIEVFNSAKLSAIFTSETFQFETTQPPPVGVVYDVDDDVNADVEPDADFQFGISKLCAKWSGFDHYRDTVTYEAAVGTTAGADDVESFSNVNTAVSHCFTGLSLSDKTKYFFSVRATGTIGDVTVSSDGVTVIDDTSHQSELEIFDGTGCGDLSLCSDDVTYQASRLHLAAWWRHTGTLESHFSHYKVGVVEDDCTQEANGISCNEVGLITSMVNVGKRDTYIFGNLELDNGKQYHIRAAMCFHSKCLPSLQTNGVIIYSEPVSASRISAQVSSVAKINDSLTIRIDAEWTLFQINEGLLVSKVLDYVWAVTSEPDGIGAITSWISKTSTYDSSNVQVSHEIHLKHRPLKQIYFSVKGFNPLGSFAVASDPLSFEIGDTGIDEGHYIFDVQNTAPILNLINSEKLKEKMRVLHKLDIDYSSSASTVSAAVTGINYPWYIWYITTEPSAVHHYMQWSYNLTDYPVNGTNATMPMPFGCDHGMTECIGNRIHTQNNYVTFMGLSLVHGTRYYTCVHSNSTTVVREKSSESLPELAMCSNGFILDTTPPKEGTVTVNSVIDGYTHNNKEMVMSWTGFADIEELGDRQFHSSGIKTYLYGIGTAPGAVDVRAFSDVGETQSIIATGLNLESGKTYYAVIRAIDHVGLSTDAVSSSFIVDTTPPVAGYVRVGSSHKHLPAVNCDSFEVHWSDFTDDHSSTINYKIAVGTHEHSQDISPFRDAYHNFEVFSGLSIIKGHHYYAQISATNAAGMVVSVSSRLFTCDSTGPAAGFVYDGPDRTQGDRDYQQDTSMWSANWFGFQDAETTVRYQVAIGLFPGTQDIHAFEDVGKVTAYTFILPLVPGLVYFTTVMACNQVDICTTAISDGVLADDSPPLPGVIRIGFDDFHSAYQAETSAITIRWFGFFDPQSFLRNYEWCIGNDDADDCSEVAYTNAHLSQEIHKAGLSLTPHVKLYVKVKATNNANLVTVTSSNDFIIDNTAPAVTTAPSFDVGKLSRKADSQYDRSVVQLTWQFSDAESPVVRHVVSVKSHDDNVHPVSDFQMDAANHVTFSLAGDRQMADCDQYWAIVTSCNAAGLCTTATSSPLLVDSTPSHLGHFKRNTLTYGGGGSTAYLEWEEFYEGQSDIEKYVVAIGSTYHSWDILAPTDVAHDANSAVQSKTFSLTTPVNVGDIVYITIYAVNGAGMTSDIGQTSVLVVSPDELFVQRHSCAVFGCKKVCSCGEYGGTFYNCRHDGAETTCSSVSAPGSLTVVDGLDINSNQDYTASDKCLSGTWSTHNNAVRYEWGFGIKGSGAGSDLFDQVTERFIFDNGLITSVAYCLPFNKELDHDARYSLYVRYWWNADEYTEVESDGVLVDHTPPSVARGYGILDIVLPTGTDDIEYTTSTSAVYARWDNTFVDRGSGIHHYEVMVGTTIEGDEIVQVEDVGTSTTLTKTGLSIPVGTKYYVTVRAVNNVGLAANKTSDGVVIDNEPPIAGVVFNGKWKHFHRFMSSEDTLEISWIGFSDRHSFIKEYQWGIGENKVSANVKGFTSAGIHNRVSQPRVDLTHGSNYYLLVKAIDASGLATIVASSQFTYDETPPQGYVPTSLGTELISHGDFTSISENDLSNSWTTTGTSSLNSGNSLSLAGHISQNVDLPDFALYQLYVETQPPCAQTFSEIVIGNHTYLLDIRDELTYCEFLIHIPLEEATSISFSFQEASEITLRKLSLKKVSATAPLDTVSSVTIRQMGMMDLFVHWTTTDFESRIRYTKIGLGSTPGGLQIAPLVNAGRKPYKLFHQLSLKHSLPVYASMLIVNEAGVQTTIISEPATVDWVAPVITNISLSYDANSPTDITGNWTVDTGSGLDQCYWALGHVHGGVDVLGWTRTAFPLSSTASALTLVHGDMIYPSIRCLSNARLESTVVGRPLLIVTKSPDVTSATVSVKTQTLTRYASVDSFQSGTGILDVKLAGFQDVTGIKEYRAQLVDGDGRVLADYLNLNLLQHTHFVFDNLTFTDSDLYNETCYNVSTTDNMVSTMAATQTETTTTEWSAPSTVSSNSTIDGNTTQVVNTTAAPFPATVGPGPQFTIVCDRDYFTKTLTLSVKAINGGGLESSPISTSVTFYHGLPTLTGEKATLYRNNVTNIIHVDWQHVFKYTGPESLRFVFSAGLNAGIANIEMWKNTVNTNHQISPWVYRYSKDYYVTINAVTPFGLYKTFNSLVENHF